MAHLPRIAIKLILPVIFLINPALADSPHFLSVKAGLGYDFVSQEYFTSSSRYDSSLIPDPLNAVFLKKDYLDDTKGLLYLRLNPGGKGDHILEVGWEQTPDIYRALGWGHFTLRGYGGRVETDFKAEVKERYRGTLEAGEELSFFQARVNYRKKWNEYLESTTRIFAEKAAFDSAAPYAPDFSRVGGEMGLNLVTQDLQSVFMTAGVEKRNVPDSSWLDYWLVRGNFDYAGELLGCQITSELGIEDKDFDSPEDRDDYLLTAFSVEMKGPIGREYFVRPILNLEYFNFRVANFLNDDYLLLRSGLLLGWESDRLSISLGPKMELLEIASELPNDDDYLEFCGFAGFDFIHSDRILFLLENQLGRRNYLNEPPYYSDFLFERVNLIGSLKVFRTLSFDILLSAEWEWHEIDSDDSRLYLLSSGLSYTF